ncbi:hypothetical protein EVAR_69451_1 [Eumeta japonica]|uniref:Uncharacterized protein n=1 Tax=Eumeta variegata TaxID=151549 RepID=A0A4C1SGP4_EUMVA|nr:hypothetical protein EVAR_69451_1 [Eumeta japonica]
MGRLPLAGGRCAQINYGPISALQRLRVAEALCNTAGWGARAAAVIIRRSKDADKAAAAARARAALAGPFDAPSPLTAPPPAGPRAVPAAPRPPRAAQTVSPVTNAGADADRAGARVVRARAGRVRGPGPLMRSLPTL